MKETAKIKLTKLFLRFEYDKLAVHEIPDLYKETFCEVIGYSENGIATELSTMVKFGVVYNYERFIFGTHKRKNERYNEWFLVKRERVETEQTPKEPEKTVNRATERLEKGFNKIQPNLF